MYFNHDFKGLFCSNSLVSNSLFDMEMTYFNHMYALVTHLNNLYDLNIRLCDIPTRISFRRVKGKPNQTVHIKHRRPKKSGSKSNDGIPPLYAALEARDVDDKLRDLPTWVLEDGRLKRLGNVRTFKEILASISKETYYKRSGKITYSRFNRLAKLIRIVDHLLYAEALFPGQKFVKYFQGKRFFAFHERNETCLDQLAEYGHPTIERLNYLYWKHNFKDFVDYAGLIEKNCCDFVNECSGIIPTVLRNSCFEKHYDHYGRAALQENPRISLYRLYWDIEYRTWDRQFKLQDGSKVNLTLHSHEILGFSEIKLTPPKTIYEHPNEHYKEILNVLFERKLKHFHVKQDFKSIVLSELKSHQDQIVPIENNLDLIREGSIMSHCIGGEEYINEGLSKQHIYFRFIPEGISPSDTMYHFTVTLSNLQPINRFVDPSVVVDSDVYHHYNAGYYGYRSGFWRYVQDDDNGEYFNAYSPVEIWGWNNAVPSKKEIKQIYQFIWNNQDLFRCEDE